MIERIAELTVKWLAIFLVFAGIGYALRMHHEVDLRTACKHIVLTEIKDEVLHNGNVFIMSNEDMGYQIRFIPRRDDKSINVKVERKGI